MQDIYTEQAGGRWKIGSQYNELWMVLTDPLILQSRSLSERESQLLKLEFSETLVEQKVSRIIEIVKSYAPDVDFGNEHEIDGVRFGTILERILGRQLIRPANDASPAKNFIGIAGKTNMEFLKRGDGLSALGKANARFAFENGTMFRTGVIGSPDFENEPAHLEVESLSQEQVFEVFTLFIILLCDIIVFQMVLFQKKIHEELPQHLQALGDTDILYHMNKESRIFKEKLNAQIKNAAPTEIKYKWLKGGWWVKMTDIIANIPDKKPWDDVSDEEIREVTARPFTVFYKQKIPILTTVNACSIISAYGLYMQQRFQLNVGERKTRTSHRMQEKEEEEEEEEEGEQAEREEVIFRPRVSALVHTNRASQIHSGARR